MSAHDGPIFERDEHGTVHRVRCSCGWSASGIGGATAFGMAWGGHANDEAGAALLSPQDSEKDQ